MKVYFAKYIFAKFTNVFFSFFYQEIFMIIHFCSGEETTLCVLMVHGDDINMAAA